MLDSINARLNGMDSITVSKSSKIDPINVSENDFVKIANTRKNNCNFLILKKHWPLEKEEERIQRLIEGEVTEANQYTPVENKIPIHTMAFEGSYLYQFVSGKTFKTSPDCMLMDVRYNNGKSDTVFYYYVLLQFTNIIYSGEYAIAFAVYRYPSSRGSYSYGFLFKQNKNDWYIDKVIPTDWDRW